MAPFIAALLPTVGKVLDKVIPDPAARDEAKARLAEIAANGELAKLAHDNKMFELEVEDRKSAREMAIARGLMPQMVLGGFITVGFFGILFYILKFGVPQEGGDVLMVMLGSLGTAWAGVVGFFFGSSSSSKDKTALLAKASPVKD